MSLPMEIGQSFMVGFLSSVKVASSPLDLRNLAARIGYEEGVLKRLKKAPALPEVRQRLGRVIPAIDQVRGGLEC